MLINPKFNPDRDTLLCQILLNFRATIPCNALLYS